MAQLTFFGKLLPDRFRVEPRSKLITTKKRKAFLCLKVQTVAVKVVEVEDKEVAAAGRARPATRPGAADRMVRQEENSTAQCC